MMDLIVIEEILILNLKSVYDPFKMEHESKEISLTFNYTDEDKNQIN